MKQYFILITLISLLFLKFVLYGCFIYFKKLEWRNNINAKILKTEEKG